MKLNWNFLREWGVQNNKTFRGGGGGGGMDIFWNGTIHCNALNNEGHSWRMLGINLYCAIERYTVLVKC